MTYNGTRGVADKATPHLGGNVLEGDPYTYAPHVWDYLIGRFGIKSVMDLGSGIGYAANYFHRKGLEVVAVDGLRKNVEQAIFPTVCHDLVNGPIFCQVDLVHCVEVVEHVDASYLDHLGKSLECGKFLFMTHATPGQTGHHHVNEQPKEYWVENLKQFGFTLLEEDTRWVREIAIKDHAFYIELTGLIFANRNRF